MSERTRATIALWRLDSELQRAETLVASLTAQLGDQVKVKAADLAIRRAHEAVARAKSVQKDAEFALAQLEARIKEHNTLLWSGKGSPRDLEALRLEVEREVVRRASLEEGALTAMEVTARAERDAARVEANVAKALAELKSGNSARMAERTDALARRALSAERREALVASMDPADVAAYERIRSRMSDGVPVAELSGARCEGCRTDLPSGFVQRVRREAAPLPCPSCGRLLHAPA
jgi:predicted  nucleic acid-binding Zn-ribbon protein